MSMTWSTKDAKASGDIPFSFLVSLFRRISQISPRPSTIAKRPGTTHFNYPAYNTFKAFLNNDLHRQFGDHRALKTGTTLAIFRLMFPDEDKERKFGMQEKVLAEALGGVLGVGMGKGGRGEVLREWRDGEGCLGIVVGEVVWEKNPDEEAVGPLSLLEVDSLLSELATLSMWSNSSFRSTSTGPDSPGRRTRKEILRILYTDLPPRDACYLTQIILEDLRPVLYPTPGRTTAESLLGFKSDSVKMLSKEDAMRLWDDTGMMRKAFDARGTFEEAALVFEGGEEQVNPVVGKKLQIPKCVKGQGCKQALRHFKDASTVYAETKYDGERVQLHYWLDEHGESHIKIYSKSGRDSTLDRAALHPLIRDTLQPGKDWQKNLILEAEMVAWSDELDRVDEFWRIRSLVESTAIGGRAVMRRRPVQETQDSQCSIISDASDSDTRHLSLIFFDVLLVDSEYLLSMPYTRRRTILSSIISPLEHGRVMLAESWLIDMSRGMEEGARQLREVFAGSLAGFEEGLVLKDGDSGWRDWKRPWVKLKKDYIAGYGDCVDMVVLGAGWDKDRARELKVGPETLTTFYLGVQTNDSDTRRDPKIKPHFEMFMLVSYGLSREQLEDANFRLKGYDHTAWNKDTTKLERSLPYTFTYPKRLPSPTVMMHEPLLAEVFGAGFTKDRGAKNYTLRFPRMTKLHRTHERSWRSAVSMSQFDKLAHEAVGRESSKDEASREVSDLWEMSMRKSKKEMEKEVEVVQKEKDERLRDPKRMERVKREWVRKLEVTEGVVRSEVRVREKDEGGQEDENGSMERGGEEDSDDHDDEQAEETRGLESSRRTTKVQGRPALGGYRTLGSMTNLALHQAQAKMPEKVTETVPPASRPKPSFPSPPSSPLRPPTSANRGLQSHSGPAAGVVLTPKQGRSEEVENDSAPEREAAPSASKGKAGRISLQSPGTPTKSRPRQQEHASGTSASSSRAALYATTSTHTSSLTRKPALDPDCKPSEYLGSGPCTESGNPGELLDGVASSTLRRKREAPQTPDTSPSAPPSKKARIVPEQQEQEQEKRLEGSNTAGLLKACSTLVASTSRPGPSGNSPSLVRALEHQPTLINPAKARGSTSSVNIIQLARPSTPGYGQITTKTDSKRLRQTRTSGSASVSFSGTSSRVEGSPAPNQYTEPFRAFLSDTVIWFGAPSTPEGSETTVYRPPWRRSSEHIIAPSARIGSFDIFLSACGWGAAQAHPGVRSEKAAKGIMLVDDTSERGLTWKNYGLDTVRRRRDKNAGPESAILQEGERKEIWVFDMQVLRKGVLETVKGDFEQFLIYRFR